MRSITFAVSSCAVLAAFACGDDPTARPDAEPSPIDARAADAEPDQPDAAPDAELHDPPTSTATPAGGAYFTLPDVTITADEAATIYYTLDGSMPTTASASGPAPLIVTGVVDGMPLRYFAVDGSGDDEAPHAETYTRDRAATLSIALGGPTVTVTQPLGGGVVLTGTATYDGGTDTAVVTLSFQNLTPDLLFNIKAFSGAINQGTFAGQGTLSAAPFSYFGPEALDAGATDTATFTLTGVDATVDPILVDLTFRTDAMWALGGDYEQSPQLVDSSGAGVGSFAASPRLGFRDAGDVHYRDATYSADGRRLFLASANMPLISVLDSTTLEVAVGVSLDPNGVGAVTNVEMSPDGATLYAILLVGEHANISAHTPTRERAAGCENADVGDPACDNTPPDLYLVKLRASDLVEQGRLPIVVDAADRKTRIGALAISPDGSRAALPLPRTQELARVDLTTMTLIDADAVTAGTQHLDLSAVLAAPLHAVHVAGGAAIYVADRFSDGTLARVDATTGAVTTETPTTLAAVISGNGGGLGAGPDGRIYVLHESAPQLQIYDPGDDSWAETTVAMNPRAIAFQGDRYTLFGEGSAPSQLRAFTLATDAPLTLNTDRQGGGFDLLLDTNHGHIAAISPDRR